MTQIQEDFEILEADIKSERLENANLNDFILNMAKLRKDILSFKSEPNYENFKISDYLLWNIWSELVSLQRTIIKVGEKTYIPLTEEIKK